MKTKFEGGSAIRKADGNKRYDMDLLSVRLSAVLPMGKKAIHRVRCKRKNTKRSQIIWLSLNGQRVCGI